MADSNADRATNQNGSHEPTAEHLEIARPDAPAVSADIKTESKTPGTVTVGLSTTRGVSDGTHRELVDRVMSHPSVQQSDRVHVVAPLGDAETISRLQDHTENFEARAAGASTVIDADVTSESSGE
jgi:hypothetical protein